MSALSAPRRDPAPSRMTYRYQRLMLTPAFRALVRIGVPLLLLAVIGTVWFGKPENRATLFAQVAALRASIETRPEFMVTALSVTGADPALLTTIRAALPLEFPLSSFDLDLETVRAAVAALPPVQSARVRIKPGGILEVDVTERVPVAVWRHLDGLRLIDAEGAFVGPLPARGDRADLPLIAGDGAQDAIAEALALFAAAGPLTPRLRGLVRMGERRWDMVLDRDQRILLPENDPVRALERVLALHSANDMLARDISVVDMRFAERPTVRLSASAVMALRNQGNEPRVIGTEAGMDE